jgi:hypothetical protein
VEQRLEENPTVQTLLKELPEIFQGKVRLHRPASNLSVKAVLHHGEKRQNKEHHEYDTYWT